MPVGNFDLKHFTEWHICVREFQKKEKKMKRAVVEEDALCAKKEAKTVSPSPFKYSRKQTINISSVSLSFGDLSLALNRVRCAT
jgi:hypothetical protein